MAQLALRAVDYGNIRPYIRAGIQGSELDVADEAVIAGDDLDEIKPAVNVGFEVMLQENMALTLEGNYSQSIGAALHFDFWF